MLKKKKSKPITITINMSYIKVYYVFDWYLDFIISDRKWDSIYLNSLYTYPLKIDFSNRHSFKEMSKEENFVNNKLVIYED